MLSPCTRPLHDLAAVVSIASPGRSDGRMEWDRGRRIFVPPGWGKKTRDAMPRSRWRGGTNGTGCETNCRNWQRPQLTTHSSARPA